MKDFQDKAAIQSITENLHFQVSAAELPITVNALFPGPHVVEIDAKIQARTAMILNRETPVAPVLG